jgi:hypothetical protein
VHPESLLQWLQQNGTEYLTVSSSVRCKGPLPILLENTHFPLGIEQEKLNMVRRIAGISWDASDIHNLITSAVHDLTISAVLHFSR